MQIQSSNATYVAGFSSQLYRTLLSSFSIVHSTTKYINWSSLDSVWWPQRYGWYCFVCNRLESCSVRSDDNHGSSLVGPPRRQSDIFQPHQLRSVCHSVTSKGGLLLLTSSFVISSLQNIPRMFRCHLWYDASFQLLHMGGYQWQHLRSKHYPVLIHRVS